MRDSYAIIKSMLRTEKGHDILPLNKYIFWVAKDANKIQIKRAVEDIYKVKVDFVNTLFTRGKIRKLRFKEGKTPDTKKAVVTLKEGSKIDVT